MEMSEEDKKKNFETLKTVFPKILDEMKNNENFVNIFKKSREEADKIKIEQPEQTEEQQMSNFMQKMNDNGALTEIWDMITKLSEGVEFKGLDNIDLNKYINRPFSHL